MSPYQDMPDWARTANVGDETEYGRVLRKWEKINELTGKNEWFVLLVSLSRRPDGTRIIFQSLTSYRDAAEFFILHPDEIATVSQMLSCFDVGRVFGSLETTWTPPRFFDSFSRWWRRWRCWIGVHRKEPWMRAPTLAGAEAIPVLKCRDCQWERVQ